MVICTGCSGIIDAYEHGRELCPRCWCKANPTPEQPEEPSGEPGSVVSQTIVTGVCGEEVTLRKYFNRPSVIKLSITAGPGMQLANLAPEAAETLCDALSVFVGDEAESKVKVIAKYAVIGERHPDLIVVMDGVGYKLGSVEDSIRNQIVTRAQARNYMFTWGYSYDDVYTATLAIDEKA